MTAALLSCPHLSGSAVQTAIPVFEVPSAALLPLQIQSGAGDDLNVTVPAFLSDWALFRPEAMLTAAGNAGARNGIRHPGVALSRRAAFSPIVSSFSRWGISSSCVSSYFFLRRAASTAGISSGLKNFFMKADANSLFGAAASTVSAFTSGGMELILTK